MAYAGPPSGDIRATLALSPAEAQNGSSRTLNLPGGRRITVPIRAGIRDGEEIRLKGQGEPAWEGGPVGDLILTVSIAGSEQFGGQTYPAYNPNAPTDFLPAPSFPPAASSPSHLPRASTGSPYSNYSPDPGYPATRPAADYSNYPPYPEAQRQEPIFVNQSQAPYTSTSYHTPYPQPGQQIPQQATPQPPKRRGLSPSVTIMLIVLLLLLIGGSGLIYYVGVYQPRQIHEQATATARAQLSATANAQALATATALATAKAQAQATANAQATATAQASATAAALQNILTQATSGSPALNDPLSAQSSSNWDELAPSSSSVNGSCTFTGGTYHSIMPQKGFFQPCFAENSSFSNFAFQVQMTITQGDEGGIIFRANPANSQFYLFRISKDGAYDLFLYVDSQGSHAKNLLSNSSSLIKTGLNQTNTITVVAQGGSLYFYINQQYLDSASNTMYLSGKIGVFAESNTNPTNVAFSNAQVWTL